MSQSPCRKYMARQLSGGCINCRRKARERERERLYPTTSRLHKRNSLAEIKTRGFQRAPHLPLHVLNLESGRGSEGLSAGHRVEEKGEQKGGEVWCRNPPETLSLSLPPSLSRV